MKLLDMLKQGFIKIDEQPRCYKQITQSLVVVCDDRGNGDYELGDLVVLNGNTTPEEQIRIEQEYADKFGRIPVI